MSAPEDSGGRPLQDRFVNERLLEMQTMTKLLDSLSSNFESLVEASAICGRDKVVADELRISAHSINITTDCQRLLALVADLKKEELATDVRAMNAEVDEANASFRSDRARIDAVLEQVATETDALLNEAETVLAET
eukprot:c43014_g1_i1.p2 GENE.c43014_g1_i1~~c43014_g1_i1.p2  ORF type:complete len:137 (+),score=33.68 c43014_g1_i1:127-537(+)